MRKSSLFSLKSAVLAVAAMCAASGACASNFYVVVPVPGQASAGARDINVSLAPAVLPSGLVGQAYAGFNFNSLLSVTGDPGYTGYGLKWSIVSGSLPAGLTLNSDGSVSGTPTAPGTVTFQLKASYKRKDGTQTYQMVAVAINVGLSGNNSALPQGMANAAYFYDFRQNLSVTGDSSYAGSGVAFSANGSLPVGLALAGNGVLSGTPTAVSSNAFAVTATYRGVRATSNYTLAIAPGTFQFNPTLSGVVTNYNVYSAARAAGWDGKLPVVATITVDSGAVVGATSTGAYAFDTGAGFPAGSSLTLVNNGSIQGAGGTAGGANSAGGNGGSALRAQYPIAIANAGAIEAGGGGGGAGGKGGTGGTGGMGGSSTRQEYYAPSGNPAYYYYQGPGGVSLIMIANQGYSSWPAGWSLGSLQSGVGDYQNYSIIYTNTVTTPGGAGGAGGVGGSGGAGRGFTQSNVAGTTGTAGAGGSAGGAGAGAGGAGGVGGSGGSGGDWGANGGTGMTGSVGNTGANGNYTGGQAGAAGSAGLAGGAAGYAVVGKANVTWSQAGTVLGPQQ